MIKSRHLTCQSNSFEGAAIDHFQSQIRKMAITAERYLHEFYISYTFLHYAHMYMLRININIVRDVYIFIVFFSIVRDRLKLHYFVLLAICCTTCCTTNRTPDKSASPQHLNVLTAESN